MLPSEPLPALRELVGTLVFHGHDLNHLLDNYTMEQLELMSQAVWQHSMTLMSVVAWAMGGDPDRVPSGRPDSDRDYSDEWAVLEAKRAEEGKRPLWNMARVDADGNVVPTKPNVSPQQLEARQRQALRKFGFLRRAQSEAFAQALPQPKTGPVTTDEHPAADTGLQDASADEAIKRMMEQLDSIPED